MPALLIVNTGTTFNYGYFFCVIHITQAQLNRGFRRLITPQFFLEFARLGSIDEMPTIRYTLV
jgi:hypothetical protein